MRQNFMQVKRLNIFVAFFFGVQNSWVLNTECLQMSGLKRCIKIMYLKSSFSLHKDEMTTKISLFYTKKHGIRSKHVHKCEGST